jgi:ABC-type polysaccharide/polyol phosphate export permease
MTVRSEAFPGRFEIIRELAVSDFRLKYHDSVLGYLWSMLSPLLMLGTFYLVFRYIVVVNTPGYLPYLAVGLVYWTFFQDCSCSGLASLAAKAGTLRSVPVPAVLVVAGAAASTVITLAINTLVLVVSLAVFGRLSRLAPLAVVPLLALVLLASGLGFLVALAHAHFRDTALIWNVLLQAGFWLTPVVYHVASPPLWEVLHWNPLARCLSLLRWFLVYDFLPPLRFVLVTFVLCAAVFAAGLALLLRHQARLPELL